MTMGLKLQITVEAKSTAEGAAPTASLVEEISFMVGAKQPSVSVQMHGFDDSARSAERAVRGLTAPDTIAFDMEASCPTEQKNFPSSLVMTVAGTLDETGEALVQVDLPCGKLHTTLNLSVDVLEASTLLFPPSVFCTLLSPFEQIIITRLDAEDQGAGAPGRAP
eukprot:g10158.t1